MVSDTFVSTLGYESELSLMEIKTPKNKEEYFEIVEGYAVNSELKELSIGAEPKREPNEKELCKIREIHKKLEEKYLLSHIAGEGTGFEKSVRIMAWLCNHTFYSGMSMNCPADNGFSILNKSFDKGFNFAINCRFRAIAFADCLVALGIKAIPLALISEKDKETGGFGCHLVVHVFDIENNKWYLFDPSFNTYFTNTDGDKLDVYSLRDCFLHDEKVTLNGYSFNGENRCSDVYIEHFIKGEIIGENPEIIGK